MNKSKAPATTRKTMGQVVVCQGCCCGRTDKGHPPVPVDWLKNEWRTRELPKKMHLSISGCLGPCDATNVVLLMFGNQAVWLGGLKTQDSYRDLVQWAADCARREVLQPLPPSLARHRLQRFAEELPNVQVA